MTPLKAIKLKCLDCSCGQQEEVNECPVSTCALYQYRFGKDLNRKKREFTEEQREVIRQRFLKSIGKTQKEKEEPK